MLRIIFMFLLMLSAQQVLARPASAETDSDGLFTNQFDHTPALGNDKPVGHGIMCANTADCERQDHVVNDRPSAPHQIENSFSNGRGGNRPASAAILDGLKPVSGR
jgi:hypothetical protein